MVKDALKLRFQFPFDLLIVFYELASKRIFFFFEFFDSFIQNLDVKLELLLYLDMVSYLTLIVLKLSFILLGRQVHRLESRREPRVIQAFASKLVSHCAVGISTACIMPTLILIPIISFLLELHHLLALQACPAGAFCGAAAQSGLDAERGDAAQLARSAWARRIG